MRFTIFLIFLTLFISEVREPLICVEKLENKEILRFTASDFSLEFKHSVYGGDVVVLCGVSKGKILIRFLESSNEASISYYTDSYKSTGNRFVSEIDEKTYAITVNEGWKIRIENREFVTSSLTRIFPCG